MKIQAVAGFLILSCILSCKPETELILKRYADGTVSLKKNLINSSDTSLYDLTSYYNNGKIFSICHIKNGNMYGEIIEYHENGNLKNKTTLLVNDCKLNDCCCDARIIDFNLNGDTIELYTRINKERNGYSFRVFPNQQRREGNFVNGKMEGIFKTFHLNGSWTEDTYENSILNGPSTEHTDSMIILGQYLYGKETGKWLIKDKEGRLLRIDTYIEGHLESSVAQ